jgi:hypothetical protein
MKNFGALWGSDKKHCFAVNISGANLAIILKMGYHARKDTHVIKVNF